MKRKIISLFLICAMALTVCGGCKTVESVPQVSTAALENFTAPDYGTEYYDNYQYNAYYNPDVAQQHLPDQGVYGSGNAFILRYNGLYYMYMGSSNFASSSLPCWVSEDLMVWEKANNGQNTVGFVAEDPRLYFAYPPCVRQYNNKFYMYLYLKNDVVEEGNYILVADSPVGPFTFVLDEDDEPLCYTIAATRTNIDADIFIDDNEDVYFMSAHEDTSFTGIRAFNMPTMDSVAYDEDNYINIAESSVGGWTEGNGFFKRNGKYYLMYTGSNILSPGYLTHYSTAIGDGWKDAFGTDARLSAPGFEQGIDWPMGCETDPTFYSLGHATSVLGPDMDGLYYHYFSVNSSGPNCTFAIDRLTFNGTGMDAPQTQYHSVKPKRPALYSYDPASDDAFTASDGWLLSANGTNGVFTAEFNFAGESTECVFAYSDSGNYWSVAADVAGKKVRLYQTAGGVKTERATGNIVRAYDAENLFKTVRVAYADGVVDVYFDDLLKIDGFAADLAAGKIGYQYTAGQAVSFGYTAASAVAKGLSDKVEPKLSFVNIGAESYLPQGVYAGHGSVLSAGSGYGETGAEEYDGAHIGLGKMRLNAAGDTATYLVDFSQSRTGGAEGYYALYMTMNKQQGGKQIGVRVDGDEMRVITLPVVAPQNGDALIKTQIALLPVAGGVHQISFTCLGEAVEFHSFTFTESTGAKFVYEQSLEAAPQSGMEQLTLWRFALRDGDEKASLVSREGARSLVYFGGKGIINYTAECDFRINTDSSHTAGFIIGGSRYSNSAYITEDYRHIQGYYVSITKRAAKIEKLNYTHTDSNAAATRVDLAIGEWHHVKITVRGSTLTVEITNGGGSATLTYTDSIAFVGGRFGFYSSGASASYRNLKITG